MSETLEVQASVPLLNTENAVKGDVMVAETGSAQFRWEVFNVLNHANLNLPVVFVNAANGATITSAGPGRLMQFALRWRF